MKISSKMAMKLELGDVVLQTANGILTAAGVDKNFNSPNGISYVTVNGREILLRSEEMVIIVVPRDDSIGPLL